MKIYQVRFTARQTITLPYKPIRLPSLHQETFSQLNIWRRQTDSQTDRLTNSQTHRQTHTPTSRGTQMTRKPSNNIKVSREEWRRKVKVNRREKGGRQKKEGREREEGKREEGLEDTWTVRIPQSDSSDCCCLGVVSHVFLPSFLPSSIHSFDHSFLFSCLSFLSCNSF